MSALRVNTFEPENPVDLPTVQKEIGDLETQLAGVRKQMAVYLKELGLAGLANNS